MVRLLPSLVLNFFTYLLKNLGLALLLDDSLCSLILLQLCGCFEIGLDLLVIVEPLFIFLFRVAVMQHDSVSKTKHLHISFASIALCLSLEPTSWPNWRLL